MSGSVSYCVIPSLLRYGSICQNIKVSASQYIHVRYQVHEVRVLLLLTPSPEHEVHTGLSVIIQQSVVESYSRVIDSWVSSPTSNSVGGFFPPYQ